MPTQQNGQTHTKNSSAMVIVDAIRDNSTSINLQISELHGKTCDGSNNMLGVKSGVAKKIWSIKSKAIERHCHGNSLPPKEAKQTNLNDHISK